MGSRRKTGGKDVRLPDLTRRSVIGAASAAPVLANAGGETAADDLIVRCASFVAIDIRTGRLVRRWGDLEGEAFKLPGWFDLSKEEQLALPQGREMAEIDRMLSSLFEQREKLLAELPGVAANDPTGVAAKIAVAARAVDPEDHEEAHHLIAGAARDLANMRCPDCHRPLVLESWIDWSIRTGRE
ncbi:hypothetical protein [Caulobacter sp. LARHSG274]